MVAGWRLSECETNDDDVLPQYTLSGRQQLRDFYKVIHIHWLWQTVGVAHNKVRDFRRLGEEWDGLIRGRITWSGWSRMLLLLQ